MLIKVMKMFMIKTVMIAITWSMSATTTTSATTVMVTVVLFFLKYCGDDGDDDDDHDYACDVDAIMIPMPVMATKTLTSVIMHGHHDVKQDR